MSNISYTELFDRYLEGEMNEQESFDFLQRLEKNPGLMKEFNLHKAIRDVLSDKDMFEMHNTLNEIRDDYYKRRGRKKRWIAVTTAAASVILLFFALQYWVFFEKASSGELYDTYYVKAEHNPTTRGATPETVSNFDRYLMLYHQGKINEALAGFSSVADTSELFLPAKYFAAQCYIQLNAHNEAIKELELIIPHSESLFYYDALWYAGLCHLKMNNKDQASEYFKILAVEENCYSEKAELIIAEL